MPPKYKNTTWKWSYIWLTTDKYTMDIKKFKENDSFGYMLF